jgi:hypothetical protein
MITFKQFMTEAPPAWTESLSTMLFSLPRAGLVDAKIPLSSVIFNRIWPKPIRTTVFHLTDFNGVWKLKRMGKKKSISAFFNIASSSIEDGIMTEGGFVVELIGDILVASPDDIGSQPDKTGRRWLVLDTLTKRMGGASKLKGMETDIGKMMTDILTKNDMGPYKKGLTATELNKAWIYLGKSASGKEKSLIIKDYIDGMEAIMKKYSKTLGAILTDYAKKRVQNRDPDSGDKPLWDEMVVNNFKIVKVHLLTGDDPEDWDETDFDLPITTYDNAGDISNYITKTVQGIKL